MQLEVDVGLHNNSGPEGKGAGGRGRVDPPLRGPNVYLVGTIGNNFQVNLVVHSI